MFNRLYIGSRTATILSKPSAPGIVIATGNTGTKLHVDSSAGMYVSTDGGWSWHRVSPIYGSVELCSPPVQDKMLLAPSVVHLMR